MEETSVYATLLQLPFNTLCNRLKYQENQLKLSQPKEHDP